MLIRIVAFLLEAVFFVLIGSALLRAWMNWLRINMRVQPGNFVMAVTDWLVKPLRRALPKSIVQSRVDWASVIAAFVLALTYGVIWTVITGALLSPDSDAAVGLPDGILTSLVLGLKMVIRVTLQALFFLVLAFAVLSWVQPGSPVYHSLGRLTEPLLAPLRRVLPLVGGVDLSALVFMLMLQIGLMLLG